MRHMSIPLVSSILWLGILSSCTDTKRAHFSAMGSPARVTCYSGGRLVLDDFSTGKVSNSDGSDGYEFKSATTGRLQQASGDCQVDYGAKRPQGWKATLPGLKTDPRVRD